MKHTTTLLGLCSLLGGCATSPSLNVLGAYFPDWMFCIVGAIVAAIVVHLVLRATGALNKATTSILPVAYTALTVLLALVGWLIFFQN